MLKTSSCILKNTIIEPHCFLRHSIRYTYEHLHIQVLRLQKKCSAETKTFFSFETNKLLYKPITRLTLLLYAFRDDVVGKEERKKYFSNDDN